MVAQISLRLAAAAVLLTAPALAQQAQRTEAEMKALYQQHEGDFDYLLGDWAFKAVSKQWGPYQGFWSATRMEEGAQVLDEFRVVGDSGETFHVSHTLRTYNAVLDQWELITTDGSGLQDVGTGHKVGNEIHIDQRFGSMTPQPSLWRIRYYNIRPDGFSWTADRSLDGGKTWVPEWLTIETRRIGPPRKMAPLAPARRVTQ